jgi:hypothetical protein
VDYMKMAIAVAVAGVVIGVGRVETAAQSRFDVGLLLGSTRATDEGTVLQFDRGTTYQATFAWGVWRTDVAQLSIEVPLIASPAFTVVPPRASVPLEYASLYLTPGIRVTALPRAHVSFFGAIGGGYPRYSESRLKADRSPNPDQRDTNAGALQFGGGVDVQGFGWLGFRGELRDVYTGARNFSLATPGPRVHNVIGSGGLVVRF